MAQRKPYNANTKYGRQRLRQQAAQNYANMSPEERQQHDATKFWVTLLFLVVVGGLIYLIGGSGAFLKWASH